MFKLIKHLKKSVVPIIAIVILLVIQAVCDLSLPEYTSKIVNVGIQQGGIERAVPESISEKDMNNLLLFVSADEKNEVLKNYQGEANTASPEKAVLTLDAKDSKTLDRLSEILAKPMLIASSFKSDLPEVKEMQEQMLSQLPPEMITPETDIFTVIGMMPEEERAQIVGQINDQFKDMPELMIQQSAIEYVKSEYIALGIDLEKMQSDYILLAGATMLGIALLSMAATILVGFLGARIAANLGRDLRGQVFKKVINFSNTELDKFSTASLITRSTNDIQQIQMLMVMLLRIVFYAPILAIGGIIKVLGTNTSMAWIIAVAVLAILSVVLVLFAVVMPKFKIVQKLIDKLNLVTREILTGIPVIRAFSTQKYEEKRFNKANTDLTKTNLFVNRVMSCMMPMMMLIMNLITILIVWRGAYSIDSGGMQVGDLMAFIQYAMQIIMAFLMISMVSIMLPRASVSAGRVDEVLTTVPEIEDPKNPTKFKDSRGGVLEFKNVSFRYPNAEEDVLSNVTFTARPGETTAFIGSTGSGKSTLINLIPRFYDVTNGEILIDGINIKNVTQHDLRAKLGYVPQKGVLFSGTIESNIKYGKEDVGDDVMISSAEVAQAADFINDKELKYQSEISQGGTNVSGGQKQRLSIARAIANNPEIFIFDDSFSALDYKTDITLRKALKKHTSQSTVLIVAQRISTILNAEQIVVLDEGKVIGIGTHKELLKTCDVYNQIAMSQLSKEELADE